MSVVDFGFIVIVATLWARCVLYEVTAFEIAYDIAFCTDAFEDSDGVAWKSVVVAPHHDGVVGIRTDDSYLGVTFQW